jgi:hypothetical protein
MSLLRSHQPHQKSAMQQFITFIQHHQASKKCFAIQDAYKLIYQSVFGIEHLLSDVEAAKCYLEREVNAIIAGDAEELIENISPSGDVVRLNLKPYKFRHGNPDRLFQAMLSTAEQIKGSQEDFLKWWEFFKQAVIQNKLDFDLTKLEAFDQKAQSENYPPLHHSIQYREANRPAYRVLKREIAEQLLLTQTVEFP